MSAKSAILPESSLNEGKAGLLFLEKLLQDGLLWNATGGPSSSLGKASSIGNLSTPIPRHAPEARSFLPSGLQWGATHEWFPTPVRELMPRRSRGVLPPFTLLAATLKNSLLNAPLAQSSRLILWIGKESWPTPFLIEQTLRITTERSLLPQCLFVETPDETQKLWAVDAALRSPGVAAVITSFSKLRFTLSQRFSLAAKHGETLGLFVRPQKDILTPSAAHTRWKVSPLPSRSTPSAQSQQNLWWEVELLKAKGTPPAQPKSIVFSEVVNGTGKSGEEVCVRVSSDMVNRSVAEEALIANRSRA